VPFEFTAPPSQLKPGGELQLLHDGAPAMLNVPPEQIAAVGVDDVDPAGHA
jgi:hypothetical protein